jgi:amidohydrolase
MNLLAEIKQLSSEFASEFTSIRRHLHAHPELSFEETMTSAYIVEQLSKMMIPFSKGIAGTGIVAWIEGKGPGKVIALRADMDALPIQEQNKYDYRSKNDGVMHACGHDVHTASLLGTAKILLSLRDHFNGKIKFIFQPGEEKIPGGASLMLKEDALAPDEPEIVLAQHVFPDLPAGKVGFRPGIYMASSDEIYITVKGKGGHAALPEKLIDPVFIAAQVIVALQSVSSRFAPPGIPTVLSFGRIEAKGAVNVIPDEVRIEGTFRTMNEEWRAKAHEHIKRICTQTTAAFGGLSELEIRNGYPVLTNNPEVSARAKQLAQLYMGTGNVEDLEIRMTAEDFAYFANKYPSVMYRLGTSKQGSPITPLHTSRFDVDESAIETGMGLMAWLAVNFLKS